VRQAAKTKYVGIPPVPPAVPKRWLEITVQREWRNENQHIKGIMRRFGLAHSKTVFLQDNIHTRSNLIQIQHLVKAIPVPLTRTDALRADPKVEAPPVVEEVPPEEPVWMQLKKLTIQQVKKEEEERKALAEGKVDETKKPTKAKKKAK
jgi:hypothetical protein